MERLPPGNTDVRKLNDRVNQLIDGRSNAVVLVTLTASATQTVVPFEAAKNINDRAHAFPAPLTANAASAMATTWAVVERVSGTLQLTVHHASAASTDRHFAFAILGG